jgi:hypothetical protein
MPEYREFEGRPADGKKPSKNVLLIGGGIGVLVIAYMYHKSKATPAATTDPNAIDPATGLPYSADSMAGFGGALNSTAGTTPSAYSYIDPATGQIISAFGGNQGTVAQASTNPQWFQQALAYLVQNGWDPISTGTALSKYLAGGPNGTGAALTSGEMDIVHAAWAAEGKPPQPVADPHLPTQAGQGGGTTGKTPSLLAYIAKLKAVYDNIVAHRKAAEKQYAAAPNASNLNLLHTYQQEEKSAYDAYMAALKI